MSLSPLMANDDIVLESYQDPNMLKTAPSRNSRDPAAFEKSLGGSTGETEGGFCYGPECDEPKYQDSNTNQKSNLLDYIQ